MGRNFLNFIQFYVLRKEKRYVKTLKKIYSSVYVRGEKIKKHRAEDRNVGKDVEMSQGVEQGKRPRAEQRRKKKKGVSISQPCSPLENLISIPSIQQLYRSLIFDKG